jgi:hypothetical protein
MQNRFEGHEFEVTSSLVSFRFRQVQPADAVFSFNRLPRLTARPHFYTEKYTEQYY